MYIWGKQVSVLSKSDLEFLLGGDVAVEAYVFLAHTKCEADELLHVQDGDFSLAVDGLAAFRLVHVKLHQVKKLLFGVEFILN